MIKKIKKFFSEMVEELRKSTWPKRNELVRSSIIVIAGMFFVSLYISLVDFSLFNVVDFISKLVKR